MTQITIDGFIHKRLGDGEYNFFGCEMTDYGHVIVAPHQIIFEIPESFNPVAAEVSALNAKLNEISDEHMKQVRQIKGRIAELLCIENTVTA